MGSSLGDILLGVCAFIPAAARALQLGLLASVCSPACLFKATWWLCLAGISANYWMHAYIWHYPEAFSKQCRDTPLKALGSTPVEVFSSLEVVAKLVQLASVLLYFGASGCSATLAALRLSPAWCWIVCACLIGIGQTLNVAMYKAIGAAGVYYGFKLGETVPWCSSFPFNVGLRHPQYVGVVLCLAGGLAVLINAELVQLAVPQLVVLWAAMYIVTSAFEQAGDNDKAA